MAKKKWLKCFYFNDHFDFTAGLCVWLSVCTKNWVTQAVEECMRNAKIRRRCLRIGDLFSVDSRWSSERGKGDARMALIKPESWSGSNSMIYRCLIALSARFRHPWTIISMWTIVLLSPPIIPPTSGVINNSFIVFPPDFRAEKTSTNRKLNQFYVVKCKLFNVPLTPAVFCRLPCTNWHDRVDSQVR